MKEKMKHLLFELIKNSKNSDRNIANILGVSQPTITRMRKRLEEKTIVEYTVTPDLTELEYELMALTLVSTKGSTKSGEKLKETLEKWMMKQPNIVFACDGNGIGTNEMMISIHKDYTDFLGLITKLRTEWSENLGEIKTFVSSIKKEAILKPYSLKYLENAT
jgi:DNA-binding Lrp family transcriptional regulator